MRRRFRKESLDMQVAVCEKWGGFACMPHADT